jgi:hypothetical protein
MFCKIIIDSKPIFLISIVLILVLRKFSVNRTYSVFLLTSFIVIPINFLQEYSLKANYLEINWSLLLAPSIFLILVISMAFNIFNDSAFKIKMIVIFTKVLFIIFVTILKNEKEDYKITDIFYRLFLTGYKKRFFA